MGLFNTSANSSQPDWSLSAEIEIFSFVLIPKTIIMQMNKINLKQTAYKLSNQLSNIIVVNICKLLISYLPRLPCTISFKVHDGSFIESDPSCLSPKEKIILQLW